MLVTAFLTRGHGNLAKRMVDQLKDSSPLVALCNGVYVDGIDRSIIWHSEKNLFFSGGVNRLVDWIQTAWPDCDCAWILNDDLEGVDAAMGDRLYAEMCVKQNIGMLSPAYNSSHPPTQPRAAVACVT